MSQHVVCHDYCGIPTIYTYHLISIVTDNDNTHTYIHTWVFPPVTSCITDLDSEPEETKQEKHEPTKLVIPWARNSWINNKDTNYVYIHIQIQRFISFEHVHMSDYMCPKFLEYTYSKHQRGLWCSPPTLPLAYRTMAIQFYLLKRITSL